MAIDRRYGHVKRHIDALFEQLLAHDGFGQLYVEMRLLRRGQKEVILHCEKQYRYVLDFVPAKAPESAASDDAASCASNELRQESLSDPVGGGREQTPTGNST